jgi:hypothetical protein
MAAFARGVARVNENADAGPFACRCCSVELRPGQGNFFRVTIEAVADPTPPTISAEELARDVRRQIEQLIAQVAGLSEEEALNQVYRRLTLYLCGPCYREWIENPVNLGPPRSSIR